MTNEEYVAMAGNYCPHCGKDTVESEPILSDIVEGGIGATCDNACFSCGARWQEQFKLTGFLGPVVPVSYEGREDERKAILIRLIADVTEVEHG